MVDGPENTSAINSLDINSNRNMKANDKINKIQKKTNNLIKKSETYKQINKKIDYISSNNNSEFKNVALDQNGIIDKKEVDVVETKKDGYYLYRSFSFFLFGNQNYYIDIKNIIKYKNRMDRIQLRKISSFFGDDDKSNVTKE